MKTEGEYAQPKYMKAERRLAVGVVVVGASIYAHYYELGLVIRGFAMFVLPLSLIWYSDQLSSWAIKGSGGWLNASNSDTAVRIFGWLILTIMVGLRLMPIVLN